MKAPNLKWAGIFVDRGISIDNAGIVGVLELEKFDESDPAALRVFS